MSCNQIQFGDLLIYQFVNLSFDFIALDIKAKRTRYVLWNTMYIKHLNR